MQKELVLPSGLKLLLMRLFFYNLFTHTSYRMKGRISFYGQILQVACPNETILTSEAFASLYAGLCYLEQNVVFV